MAGTLDALGIGGIASSTGFIGKYWLIIAKYSLLIFAVLAFLIYIYWYWWRHPVEIKIFSKRGGLAKGTPDGNSFTVRINSDCGRFKLIDGARKLVMFWNNKKIPLPENKYVYSKTGIFRKWFVCLLEDDIGNYVPITLAQTDQIILRPDSQLNIAWTINDLKQRDDKHTPQSFFVRYANILLPMAFITVFFVITLILLFQMKDISASLTGVANAISNVASSLSATPIPIA